MAIERRDPVPAGRYSVFILPEEEPRWKAWLAEHAATVRPIMSVPQQRLASNTPIFATTWMGDMIQDYAGSEVLFRISAPTPWVQLGLPTIETRSDAEWLAEVRKSLVCYWVWTASGPIVECSDKGPERIGIVSTIGPWVLAGFLGYVWLTRR
jgi:hypothetical protein